MTFSATPTSRIYRLVQLYLQGQHFAISRGSVFSNPSEKDKVLFKSPYLAFLEQVSQGLVVVGVRFFKVPPSTSAASAGVLVVAVGGSLVEVVTDLFAADDAGEAARQGNHHVILVDLPKKNESRPSQSKDLKKKTLCPRQAAYDAKKARLMPYTIHE